ncbi:chemotaxis response regulator protein-glutamate methylesterase [Sphingomonas sp. BAUL-RG-20F-R05-02]|uniref:protein-glutamate methylesterase/protein-glutamine glutaminase n=1 Tax=Sphingomonas sp. BAUL-RG-20F-R05-02 TaxID=2914830 RepID=UPI001F595084|nr:chemotaxis response regulator protein-glutamate methylesterase [Sphingomonas sp. BAUL-RG-20F-R05-02]
MSAPAPATPVRVLIVDDSASMRAMLRAILSADPEIEVVGGAPEPHAAREMIKALDPDVLTLDVEMPGMDGLSFLERLMRLRPMPVVMCSTLTARGAEVSVEALRLGAVDCIAKPVGGVRELARDGQMLRDTVKAAARTRPRAPSPAQPVAAADLCTDCMIAIGASTGGVEALFSILSALPVDCPPVLIVQHMPAAFTAGFASRLDRLCPMRVVEALDGTVIVPGTAYVAPGGRHMGLSHGRIKLSDAPPVSGHRPSVDHLFRSIAGLGARATGVILTGMGADGAQGLRAMRDAGARTLGQNEASCIVYGMPRAACEAGAVEHEHHLNALPRAILSACQRIKRER